MVKRQTCRTDAACRFELLFMGAARIADLLGGGRKRALETQLDMVKPGLGPGFNPAIGDADARGDEIGIDAAPRQTRQ